MENIPLDQPPFWIAAIVFVLFVLLPIVIIYSGIKILRKTILFRKNALQVMGKVVDVKQTTTFEQQTTTSTYQPVFEYEGPGGNILSGETAVSSSGRNYPIGSVHLILINPIEPKIVHMNGNTPYIVAMAILVVGGAMFYFGSGAFLSMI